MEQSEREQRAKRKYELRVLQSQINPHFLYNTLDSIIWMAEWGKNQEVVKMTSSLARLLRRSISNDQEVVTIGEEIEYTEAYLTIQKMRYQDKLEYQDRRGRRYPGGACHQTDPAAVGGKCNLSWNQV